MAAGSRHDHDHTGSADENFQFRGNVARKLCADFIKNSLKARVLCLQGFTSSGKTRTSKEYARMVANQLREEHKKEAHTFYFDLQVYKTRDELVKVIFRDLKSHIQEWREFDSKVTNTIKLCNGFKACSNGVERTYIIVLDNVNRVCACEHSNVLDFIQHVISNTDNVYIVVTSRTSVKFVRMSDDVKVHHIEEMSDESAKDLLREASGNPEGLEEFADDIIRLVYRCPLALMIAGYEMNGKRTQLSFTPKEFVEIMKDSTCLTLGLDNVPENDRLCDRVQEIVVQNYEVLEKVTFALEDPSLFDPQELYESISDMPTHLIKQSLLHILLNGSLYSVTQDKDKGMAKLLQSAPFVMKVLDEAFCHICQKDYFLKEINIAIIKALGGRKDLLTSKAEDLKKAEKHVILQQKRGNCSAGEMRNLRGNVISEAIKLSREVIENVRERNQLSQNFSHILEKVEKEERVEMQSTSNLHNGIQETHNHKQTLQVRTEIARSREQGHANEPEACLSPTNSTSLPDITECPLDHTIERTLPKAGGAEVKGTVPRQSQEERCPWPSTIEDKIVPSRSPGTENPEEKERAEKLDSEKEEVLGIPKKDSGQEPFGTLSSKVATNSRETLVPTLDGIVFATSGPSDVVASNDIDNLAKRLLEATCVSDCSTYGPLNSNDCRRPIQEHQHSAAASYSNLSTTPDQRVLTFPSSTEAGKHEDVANHGSNPADRDSLSNNLSGKEAVESEVNWQESESTCDSEEMTDKHDKLEVKDHASNYIAATTCAKELGTNHQIGLFAANATQNPNLTIEIPRGSEQPLRLNQEPYHQPGQHGGQWYPDRGQGILGPSPAVPTNHDTRQWQSAQSPQWGTNPQYHMGYNQQNRRSHTHQAVPPPSPRNNFRQQVPNGQSYGRNSQSRGRHRSGSTPVQQYHPPGSDTFSQGSGPPPTFFPSNVSSPSPSFQPRGPPTPSVQPRGHPSPSFQPRGTPTPSFRPCGPPSSSQYQYSHQGNSPGMYLGEWASPNTHHPSHVFPPNPTPSPLGPPTPAASSIQPLQTQGYQFDASGQPMSYHDGHHRTHHTGAYGPHRYDEQWGANTQRGPGGRGPNPLRYQNYDCYHGNQGYR